MNDFHTLSNDELVALELRYWIALQDTPASIHRERRERWRGVLREVRRRRLFDRLVWS